MNYLAHLLLSGDDRALRFGNFIGDSVKGKKYLHLPLPIQKGVMLHRQIDTFTDSHPLIKESKMLLDPVYRHYKGVVIDVYFDHFLSKNWLQYHPKPLATFLAEVEVDFGQYKHFIPEENSLFYQKFVDRMFMYQYDTFEGIEMTFRGLEQRIGHKAPLSGAVHDLVTHYETLRSLFIKFFAEIDRYSQSVRLKQNADI